jgi:hypothetical protein
MFASKYISALLIGIYWFHIGIFDYIKEKDYIDQKGDCHVEKEAYSRLQARISILGQSMFKLHIIAFVTNKAVRKS